MLRSGRSRFRVTRRCRPGVNETSRDAIAVQLGHGPIQSNTLGLVAWCLCYVVCLYSGQAFLVDGSEVGNVFSPGMAEMLEVERL